MDYGTKHVGVRRVDGSREWEAFDRETGNRVGMPLPSRWEASDYAEHRQSTTFGDVEGWGVTVDAHGMVTRGDPRPQTLSPFVIRALEGKLPAKELAR